MPFLSILSLIWGGFTKFLGVLFTFFTTKPGVYIGIALLLLAALWYANHHGYNSGLAFQKQADETQFATFRANQKTLQAGLMTCNDSVDALGRAGDAKTAAAQKLADQAIAEAAKLRSNISGIKAIKSTAEVCPVADAIIMRGFQ